MSLSLRVRRLFSKPSVRALRMSRRRRAIALLTALPRRQRSWVNAALAVDDASRRWCKTMQCRGQLELRNQSCRPHDQARAWDEARRGLEGRTARGELGKVERLLSRESR